MPGYWLARRTNRPPRDKRAPRSESLGRLAAPRGSGVERYGAVVQRIVAGGGVVMLIGGLDSGKSTLAKTIAGAGLLEGRTVGYVDSDLGQKTVGPPAAVTMRMLRTGVDLEPAAMAKPDALSFVGSTSPQGQLLPLVGGG